MVYVQKVRKSEAEAPRVVLDYGNGGPNPYGVGASSLAGEVRKWVSR